MDPDFPPPAELPKPLDRSGSDSSLSSPRDLPPTSETPTLEKVDKVVNRSGSGSKLKRSGSKSDIRPTGDSKKLGKSLENLQQFAAESSSPPPSPRTRMGEVASNPLEDDLFSSNQPVNLQESGEVEKKNISSQEQKQHKHLKKTTHQRNIQSRFRTSSAPSSSPSNAPADVSRMRSTSGSTNYGFVQIPDETPRGPAFVPTPNLLNIKSETIKDDFGEDEFTELSALTNKEKKESAPINTLEKLQKLASKFNDTKTNKEIKVLLKKSKPDKGKIDELISICLLNIRQNLINNTLVTQQEKDTSNVALGTINNYLYPPKLEALAVTEDKYLEALAQLKAIINRYYK